MRTRGAMVILFLVIIVTMYAYIVLTLYAASSEQAALEALEALQVKAIQVER